MNLKQVFTVLIALLVLGAPHLSAANLKKGEWSVQLVLTSDADDLEDPYNTLGQLRDAAPGFDEHDLPELTQTWAGTYLSVIFYRPDWETDRETFNTDFHPVARKQSDEWLFEVRSDDPYRDLSLTWVGKRTKMKRMVLVDLQEDVVFPAVVDGEPQVYQFRMNGTVREFAWRVLTRKEYKQLVGAGREKDKAKRKKAKKSHWLPKGWGQGEGRGHRRDRLSEGLPEDPFGD
tara:strand:+ start:252 stop:947 length:696 start_codon:yes stop_codon:yes gene_type:complete